MSSLTTTGPQSLIRPYAIYDGNRTGDAFLEWNMGQNFMTAPPADLDVLYGLGRLMGMGQVDQLFGAASKLFGDSVESIEFRSQVTPSIVINQPFAPAGQRPPAEVPGANPITKILLDKAAKPAIYVRVKGGIVYPIEPYGAPTQNYTPLIVGAGVLSIIAGAFVGVKLSQKFFCKK